VAVVIAGEQGGRWVLTRTPERWRLAAGTARAPATQVTLDADTAWRRWTRGIGRDAARAAASISGERSLGLPMLDAVAIIGWAVRAPQPQNRLWAPNRAAGFQGTRGPRCIRTVR
jgi:hypothetical protein